MQHKHSLFSQSTSRQKLGRLHPSCVLPGNLECKKKHHSRLFSFKTSIIRFLYNTGLCESKMRSKFFQAIFFPPKDYAREKKNLKTSVYHRMKVRKTSALLLLFDERIEKPSWLNFNPIAEVGVNRCLSHNLFLVYIVFLRCKCSN